MHKIGIITFQETNNYGAILQNYALQQAINKLGCIAETINYKSEYIAKPYKFQHLFDKGFFKWLFGIAGFICYMPRNKKNNVFRKKISFSEPVCRNDLKHLNNEYDYFITGSDQVFNYKLTGEDTSYLLDFVDDKGICSSYAASLGLSEIENSKKYLYERTISKFNTITLREKSSTKVLSTLLDRQVETVLDPCFLLSKQDWENAMQSPKTKNRYVFVYQLGVSNDLLKLAVEISKKLKLRIIFVPFPVGAFIPGKWDFSAGSAELIGYLHNADYIITDSFHGTVFSIIFHKPFFTKADGTHAAVGARISDLLATLGLETRDIGICKTIDIEREIDYNTIDKIIETERIKSIKLLSKMIGV